MDSDPLTEELRADVPQAVKAPPSHARVTMERIAIGFIASVSLLIPVIFGLLFYLALTDGIIVNANDPLREIRLWMVQERSGATGLGLTVATPRQGAADVQCAATSVAFLKWDRRLRLESDAGYCRCYKNQQGQLVETSSTTCTP